MGPQRTEKKRARTALKKKKMLELASSLLEETLARSLSTKGLGKELRNSGWANGRREKSLHPTR